jgi:phosphoribosyl 1,2-cyclic phosphate phosphodiesterase
MKLTFLGTGTSTGVPTVGCCCAVCKSPAEHDKRTRPSLLLEYSGHTVVIDTTPDFRGQALRQNIQRVDAVVFTHAHADHVLGLDDVRPYYFRQKDPIPIYADTRCMESLRRIFTYITHLEESLKLIRT